MGVRLRPGEYRDSLDPQSRAVFDGLTRIFVEERKMSEEEACTAAAKYFIKQGNEDVELLL